MTRMTREALVDEGQLFVHLSRLTHRFLSPPPFRVRLPPASSLTTPGPSSRPECCIDVTLTYQLSVIRPF